MRGNEGMEEGNGRYSSDLREIFGAETLHLGLGIEGIGRSRDFGEGRRFSSLRSGGEF